MQVRMTNHRTLSAQRTSTRMNVSLWKRWKRFLRFFSLFILLIGLACTICERMSEWKYQPTQTTIAHNMTS